MIQDKIEKLLLPVVVSLGYEFWGSECISKNNGMLLRIYIDKTSVVCIEDCERTSHEIATVLDVAGIIHGHYTLEVSSPGVPRKLFNINQYARYIGHLIEIKLHQPLLGQRKFVGELESVEVPFFTLKILPSQNNKNTKQDILPSYRQFSFSDIMHASVLSK